MTKQDRQRIRTVVAASYLGVSRSTLAKWRMRGEGPPFHHLGPRIVYYYKDEIDDWLKTCDERKKRAKPK